MRERRSHTADLRMMLKKYQGQSQSECKNYGQLDIHAVVLMIKGGERREDKRIKDKG